MPLSSGFVSAIVETKHSQLLTAHGVWGSSTSFVRPPKGLTAASVVMMAIILKGYSAWRRNMEQRIISSVLGLLIFAQHISGDDLGKCEILSPRKKNI